MGFVGCRLLDWASLDVIYWIGLGCMLFFLQTLETTYDGSVLEQYGVFVWDPEVSLDLFIIFEDMVS
jgi:hypothetical protein